MTNGIVRWDDYVILLIEKLDEIEFVFFMNFIICELRLEIKRPQSISTPPMVYKLLPQDFIHKSYRSYGMHR